MLGNFINSVKYIIANNSICRFWFLQICFWTFTCIVAFFTLILWYGEANLANLGHVFMQAIVGIMCSLFIYFVFNLLENLKIISKIITGLILVLSVAFLWTVIHMKIFILLTGFKDVWDEFGGWYFSGIFIFLCWTGIFQWMHYYNLLMIEHKIMLDAEAASREEHIKRLQAQREARDYKLKMLRYQLNPHFLYNSLNAINSLVEMEQSKKAQKMVEQLSDFLRYSIDNDPDLKIHLTKEIEALNLYLAIEKTRFGNRLNVKFNINSDIETALIPSLLLQPIIENSMKYAIAMSEDGGTIEISADVNLNGNFLHLSVKDTGNNTLGKSELEKNSNNEKNRVGLGLTNINQRLYAFYFQNYSLNSESNEMGGLTTNILIPLEFE